MAETVLVAAAVACAAFFWLRRLRRAGRGDAGCGCGSGSTCAKCPRERQRG